MPELYLRKVPIGMPEERRLGEIRRGVRLSRERSGRGAWLRLRGPEEMPNRSTGEAVAEVIRRALVA